MEIEKAQELMALRFSFIGKILATFSHELKNHLAVIKEHNGLIYDLIELGKLPVKNDYSDQYISSLRSVNNQIEKTLALIRYFNRFSHRMDFPLSTFSISEVIEELLALMNRLANQRKIKLESDPQGNMPQINSDPSGLQFVIFSIITDLMLRLAENSSIKIRTFLDNSSAVIQIVPKGNISEPDEGYNNHQDVILHRTIADMGGNISSDGKIFTIIIPLSAGDAKAK